MKKFLLGTFLVLSIGLTGCQTVAKNYGGSMTIDLESNQKLEEITWIDDDLWYLTKPMTSDDTAETHTFQQSKDFGVFEGTVTIVEHKK